LFLLLYSLILCGPRSTLFPYTTLFRSRRRDGLLDLRVLGRRAGLRGLEQVVEARELDDRHVPVAALLERFADRGEVGIRRHLEVQGAVEGEHRHLEAPQRGPRVVVDEVPVPRRHDLPDLLLDGGLPRLGLRALRGPLAECRAGPLVERAARRAYAFPGRAVGRP